ncbi:MAG: QueT transporter family protein [Clostridiales bacterium]|nr:QueT transporter family protein [Clostridiales bacterium]
MRNKNTLRIVQAGVIAALYAALTYFSNIFALAYSGIQFRISEALTVLPVFTPAAIPGLAVGCVIANLASPFGVIDIICGSVATLLAGACSRALGKLRFKGLPVLSSIMPVIFNMLIIGMEISFLSAGGFSAELFVLSAIQVGAGELAVCLVLGLPLFRFVEKSSISKYLA